VGQAGVHVLHVSTEKLERGVNPKPGANLFKGGREVDGETVLGRERPRVDIGRREDEEQGSGAEVQEPLEGVTSVGDQRTETSPVLEFGQTVRISEEGGASGLFTEGTDMRWKGSQEGLEGAASFQKRLAMTSVVAEGRDREERPGRVEAANGEKSREAVTDEGGTGGSEFVGVMVEGKDNPAAEGATGM
jgi:hypothetical protein